MDLLVRTATSLKTVVFRTPVNDWLDPMKEALSNEGLFLFQRHPIEGVGTVRVEVCLPSAVVSPTLEIPDGLPSRGEGDAFPK